MLNKCTLLGVSAAVGGAGVRCESQAGHRVHANGKGVKGCEGLCLAKNILVN